MNNHVLTINAFFICMFSVLNAHNKHEPSKKVALNSKINAVKQNVKKTEESLKTSDEQAQAIINESKLLAEKTRLVKMRSESISQVQANAARALGLLEVRKEECRNLLHQLETQLAQLHDELQSIS